MYKTIYVYIYFRYDPHATQFIRFGQLSDFIASLDPPLGISKPNTVALVSFNLPIAKGNRIHCLDILHSLVKHVLGHVEETDTFRQVIFTVKYIQLTYIRRGDLGSVKKLSYLDERTFSVESVLFNLIM